MSWAEYKKKREEQENMETSYSQENNDSNNETSSWQKYKQKREEQKVQQTETLPVANKANTAPKTTTNLTEADLRKIEQNSGLKTGTLNLNKMQAQQQKFENLQQKGNEELKSGAKLINEKQKKFNNFKNDAKIIGSNLKDSALSGGFQLLKTVGMMEDNAYNTQVDMRRILLENTINEREKRGLSTDELKEELNNSSLYKKSDVKPFYQEKINKINQRMAENTEKASNPVTKKIAGLSQSLGNNAVGGVVTAINPTAGFAYFTGSAMGSYYDEAVNERGMSDREARNYATIMGLMEGETDKYLAAENIKGVRKIMEGTGLKKSLESFGLEIGENFVQEAVMPAISELATKSIAGNEHLKYDFRTANGWKELARDSLSDGIDGALSAILLGGTTRGVASCVNLTNKARNGGKISKQEIKTAISDAQKSGVNVETILKDKIQENAKKRVLNLENETSGLSQNVQNNIEQQTIQTDTKNAQNQNISQISDTNENNLKNTAINEINNSKISEQAKKDMLNAINSMENVDEESYNNIKQTLNEINKNELQTNSKYQDNLERRKNYVKYKDDINTYDNSAVEEVLSIIPTNRNGKRTVNQWLQVADEIGKRISGKSNAEIQEIAYKSWFENQPTKNITQYDSARKTSIGFQKLNSDMWVNKINEAVLKERTRLENTTNSQQVNFNNTQTNQESLFEDILNNKELPMQSYIYEKSDNPNVDILRKSASKYLNNSEQAHKFVQILEKISQDKNVEIRFDADLKTPEGKIANGSYSNGVITINPNSTRAGEFIAIHELTHAIGTKQMENIIEKYSKSNIEFNEETKKLLQNYSNTEMNEEALADISGQLFGTQEFINNISQNNPNVFQKIYSEIKYLWHQFKGYKTQDQFIDDLYYKWTQAYNSNNKLNNTENYHVSENFSSEIDKALNNKLQANTQVKARDYTPQILVDNGVDNLPMLITQRHIKSTIYTLQEAENLGLPTKNVNYHGLGKDLLIKAIDNLDSPQAIYKTSENNYLVVTEFKDNNGKEIVIPIQINGNGRYNNVFIDENQIKSVYGRNNLNNYINKNNFEQIYKKNEELDFNEGIQYSNVANSSIKDSIAPQNENVNTTTKYSMQESENNSGSFNFDKNVKRYEDLQEAKAIKFNKKTDGTINIEITNDNELINQLSVDSKDNALKQLGSDIANYIYDNATEDSKTIRLKQTKNIEVHDTSHKGKQLEIIKKTNPMLDDYHVGIRNVEDIKAFNEVVNDEDSFVWGDFTREDAKKALKEGKITVYSSYPINQGTFVSTSKIQAEQYAGGKGNKIYSKTIPLEEVAWINGDEGQYANTTTRYSKNNQTWQDYLEKNYKTAGTRTNLEDILVSKATNNNKERVRDILSRNGSFSEQVDKYIADKLPSGDFLYLGETPTVLQNLGLPNNEVILKQSKLKNLMQESNNNTDKLHELPIETIKKIPEAIANPLNILQSSTDENSVVIITDLADANERPIIASIEVNYDGQIGNIDFLSNRLTSAYGKNNYDRFMKTEIAKGNLLYDIDEGIIKELPATRLQSPKGISSFVDTNNNASTINNSISQNNDSVKSNTIITNNYAQQTQNDTQNNQNVAPSVANNSLPVGEYTRKKTMNPIEIANLKPQDASTTPTLEQKNYKKGNKQSSFLSNIITDSKFLNEDLRQEMSKEDSIKYYEGITNKGTLESAYNKLQKNGQEEVIKWHTKDSKNATAEDVATGWILLKQYQDNGDYQSAVEVAKKMRDIGTTAGQTVQAYNILSRLTPEGMFYYAQSELDEAYNRMVEGKSKKWIEENQSKFNLTPEETQSILDIMKDVSTMEDGYNKKVKLAEIQKIITDKIPPTAGQSIKAWMRISMLFNPKTQVRNVMGNAVITPVNMLSDSISAGIDKIISKKTGVRTTGRGKIVNKNYLKGFGKGLYQSYNDFKKGINTRDIEGNRFEISEGKSFKNKGIGKALNRVDNLLSFMLDVGDRGFYEATFTNSINNQMLLNKVDAPTQEMIDIATTEALQRTWQDNNKYTQSVLKIRNILNNANIKGYGLGDVLIPFAKTPANLTKAIVDYSPAGLVKTLATDARILKNSLENGQYTAQVQHRFVQNLGKGMAGTFLYVLSYGLAKAGIATGESDDDKDVKNFMKNSLGISSYSIKIGDKTFSYDWAQPVATPLAIMTNYVKYSKENPDANILEKGINAMNIGTEQLLQQSFMESLNTVLNGNGTTLENLSQAILDLPARAIPTFSRQIADMVDGTQRTTFEYGRPIKSAINSVVAKIPVVSKTLPASVNTLGNEIQKYGGNNNLWNVMLNPANTNKGHLSKAGGEIYNIYKETGDKTIFPRTAPYYINNKNEKVTMTAEQRNKFQTISGKYVESSLTNLLRDKEYQKLSSEEKANIINEIVSDSYSKAKYDVLNIDSKEYEKLRNTLKNVSASSYYNYKFKTKDMKKDCEKIKVLATSDYDNKEKTALYEQYILSTEDKKYPIVKTTNIDIIQYLQYKLADANGKFDSDKKDNGTVKGKSIRGSGDQKRWQYIENMNITYTQKLILYGLECTPSNKEQTQIVNYINSLPKTQQEKLEMLSKFQGFTIYKDGTFKY